MTQCSFDGISVFSLFSGWGSLDILTPPFWYRMYLRFLISVGLEETLDRKTIKESAAVFIRTSADGSGVRPLGEKRFVSPGLGEALDGSPTRSDSVTVFIRTSADEIEVRHSGEKRSVSPGLGEALDGSPGCSDSGTRGRGGWNLRAPKAARECSIKHIALIILHAMRPPQRQDRKSVV